MKKSLFIVSSLLLVACSDENNSSENTNVVSQSQAAAGQSAVIDDTPSSSQSIATVEQGDSSDNVTVSSQTPSSIGQSTLVENSADSARPLPVEEQSDFTESQSNLSQPSSSSSQEQTDFTDNVAGDAQSNLLDKQTEQETAQSDSTQSMPMLEQTDVIENAAISEQVQSSLEQTAVVNNVENASQFNLTDEQNDLTENSVSNLMLSPEQDDDSEDSVLDDNQTLPFITPSFILSANNAELVLNDVNLLSMLSNLNQPFDSHIDEQTGNINETADCAYGGSVKVSENSSASSANLVYSYQDCEDYNGKLNGQLKMTADVNQYNSTATSNVTGNLVYQYATDYSGQARTVAINDILQTIEIIEFAMSTYQQANFTVSNAQDEGSYSMQYDGPALLDFESFFSDSADESTHTIDITGADKTNIQIIQEGYSNSYLVNGEEFEYNEYGY